MDEILAFFMCSTNLFTIGLVVIVGLWARRRVRALQDRLAQVEHQLAASQPAHSMSPVTLPAAPVVPPELAPDQAPMLPEHLIPALEVADAHTAPLVALAPPPPAADSQPASPPRPPFWETNPLLRWFTSIHLMVQIGVIVLFFGVGFLVKYAADQGWFPLELRLASAALLGVALAGVGWRVRNRARTYGLALIGGGIGIVYLTTFGAYNFYALIPAPLAFGVFVGLGMAYALMALFNDAWILALLALIGAFLAPILASGGGGNHVILFSYYAVVNAGVLGLARFKQWRSLNVISFGFTLLAGIGWGAQSYTAALFNSTEFFLLLFFCFYLTITVWFAQREGEPGKGHGLLDTLLLFANPLAAFALQVAMLLDHKYAVAYSALGLAASYAVLSVLCAQRWRVPALVTEAFIFLATFFLAISVPLLIDPKVTPAIWAVLGTGLVWLGARRQRLWCHCWGMVVHLCAGMFFLGEAGDTRMAELHLFANYIYFSTVILSLAALTGSYILLRSRAAWPKVAPVLTIGSLLAGLAWWFGGGLGQLFLYVEPPQRLSAVLIFVTLSGAAAELIGSFLDWPALRATICLVLPVAAWLAIGQWVDDQAVFANGGWVAWPLVLVVHLLMLWRWTARKWLTLYHAGGVWLLTFVLTRFAVAQVNTHFAADGWGAVGLLGVPALVLLFVGPLNRWLPWPLAANLGRYAGVAAVPIAFFLVAAAISVSFSAAGDSAPLPYLPVLNPLDVTMLTVMVVLWLWALQLKQATITALRDLSMAASWVCSLFAFLAANAGVARAVHQLAGVPFAFSALYDSATLQTTYAIFWGALALVLMFVAHHRGQQGGWHEVWYSGAAILALTVLKLFVVDLAHTGTVARIISFMSVGLLIIVIAYFWPVPPRRRVAEV